jgi:hypothetical protein
MFDLIYFKCGYYSLMIQVADLNDSGCRFERLTEIYIICCYFNIFLNFF